jgi:hypothetical protein
MSQNEEYAALRFWICRARLGDRVAATKDLTAFFASPKEADEWAAKLGAFLTGALSERQLREGTPDTNKGCSCQVAYYMGVFRLLDGHREDAEVLFTKCKDTGMKRVFEDRSAVAELDALPKGK